MLGSLLTRILGRSDQPDPFGDLRETLRDLRGDLKEVQRDVADLDERFKTFQGRMDKRLGRAKRDEVTDSEPVETPRRHPEVVAVLQRRGQG